MFAAHPSDSEEPKGVQMPQRGDVWVSPHDGQWTVKVEGESEPESLHATQEDAIEHGRERARANKSELLIQGEDGQIRKRSTFGNDPRASKG
jgi:hypothetical protein